MFHQLKTSIDQKKYIVSQKPKPQPWKQVIAIIDMMFMIAGIRNKIQINLKETQGIWNKQYDYCNKHFISYNHEETKRELQQLIKGRI